MTAGRDGAVYTEWIPKLNIRVGRRISGMEVTATERTSISVADIDVVSVVVTSAPSIRRPNVLKIKNNKYMFGIKKKYILH